MKKKGKNIFMNLIIVHSLRRIFMSSFVVLLILHTTLHLSNSFVINQPTHSSKVLKQPKLGQHQTERYFTNHFLHSRHQSSPLYTTSINNDVDRSIITPPTFNLTAALFCAGLAFDAYSEPSNSSRWEKGVSIEERYLLLFSDFV